MRIKKTHTENKAHLYLRKAADEGVVSTGAVLCVQAVVEEAGMAGINDVQADVELCSDAAPQVAAAAGELNSFKSQSGQVTGQQASFTEYNLRNA